LTLQTGSYATLVGEGAAAGADGERLSTRMANLGVRYFLGDGWSTALSAPMGTIEHRKPDDEFPQRVSGFGDVEVALSYDLAALWGAGGYRPSATLEMGLRLPSGEEAKTGGLHVPPTMLALGWGTFALTPRLTLTQFLHPNFALGVPLGIVTPVGTSPFGLKYGTSVTYGLTVVWLPGGGFTLAAGVDGRRRSRAVSEEEGEVYQSGGHWMVGALAASLKVTDRTTVILRGRLPILADVNGTQLTETWSAIGTVAWRFGELPGHEHDHGDGDGHGSGHGGGHGHGSGHGHGDGHGAGHGAGHGPAKAHAPATAGGDNRHIARGGRSFALADALVPGKLTVIDYWAEWCAPCKGIGAVLDDLASTHDKLAVRKAEVPGLNTAIAQQRLPGVRALPVVHIYGADGKLLKTLNGTSAAAVKATVLALLPK